MIAMLPHSTKAERHKQDAFSANEGSICGWFSGERRSANSKVRMLLCTAAVHDFL